MVYMLSEGFLFLVRFSMRSDLRKLFPALTLLTTIAAAQTQAVKIDEKYPKGLPATLAGFKDEAKFLV